MATSEEYLAKLGFDTSSLDSSVNSSITVLGHLAEAFPQVQKQAEAAQRALGATGTASASANQKVQALDKSASSLSSGSLPRMRYALYDVSNAIGIAGIAMTGFGALAYKTAIDYEAEFAQVIRTTGVTGDAVDKLYTSLLGLSQTTPVSFQDVTAIAAMAGQLGIANSQIVDFTKNVAEFSATTNVSVNDSATAFGRLNALLPDVKGNYAALGSAILNVGINSVATESQIIAISTRIAGISASVGLTSSEVIGLSGALASLGVQPELAQGTITRVFTKLQVAVQEGGAQLEDFGRISGTSGAQFAAAFKADAGQAFISLLRGINDQGDGAIAALQSLGITSARDIPTILKASQNTDLFTKSFDESADATAKATQLGASYNIVAKTTAAQLKELKNNADAFLAAIGKSGTTIGGFIQGLDSILQSLTAFASTDIGNGILGFGVLLVTATGIAALAGSAFLRLAATVLAVQTAEGTASGLTGVFSAALGVLTGSSAAAAEGQSILATSAAAATTSIVSETGATVALSGATGIAAVGLRAMRLGVVGLAAALGLGLVNELFNLTDAAASNKISFTDASDALSQYNKQLAAFKSSSNTAPEGVLGNPTTTRGTALTEVTGANAGVGSTLASAGLGGIASGYTQAKESIDKIDESMAKLVASGNAATAAKEFKKWADAGKELGLSTEDVTSKFPQYEAASKKAADASKTASAANKDTADSAADAIKSITDETDSVLGIQNALYGLGESLATGGDDFSQYSVNGRANLDALEKTIQAYTADAGGNSQALANNLQGLFNAIIAGGQVSASSLGVLSQAIASLGVTAITPTAINLQSLNQGFSDGSQKAAKLGNSVGGAQKQVKTLVDYANDLSGVFSRAFDIRFGSGQALDTITKGWQDIAKSANDAAQAMADAQAKLDGLAADKAADEYWLRIANAYGDTLRAAQIQADLAKNASDTASAQTDLAQAQTDSSKTLVGNTEAAINNRSTILGLVSNYQDYIKALAASGADQATLSAKTAQLKQDFIAQATQLGFNQSELQTYAASFDDVTTAIARVPRNITVTANVDPAIQALNEFVAKAATAGGQAGAAFNNAFGSSNDAARASRLNALLAEQAMLVKSLGQTGSSISPQYAVGRINAINAAINSGQYRSGGWTGAGNDWDVAGVVHANEFVLNSTGAQMFPQSMLQAANQGVQPTSYGSGSSVAFPDNLVVSLSATDRQLLADGKVVTAVISPGALADATSTQFAGAGPRGS